MPYNAARKTTVYLHLINGDVLSHTTDHDPQLPETCTDAMEEPDRTVRFPKPNGNTATIPGRSIVYVETSYRLDFSAASVELWQNPDTGALYLRDPEEDLAYPIEPTDGDTFGWHTRALFDNELDLEDFTTGNPVGIERFDELRHIATCTGASIRVALTGHPIKDTPTVRAYLGTAS